MTEARPTSEPVPAVVGTPIVGRHARDVHARVPVLAILEIPDRPRLPDHQRDRLAGVERAAAAERDDAVVRPPAAIRRDAVRDVGFDRVRLDVGEDSQPRPARGTTDRACDHRQRGERPDR